MGSGDQMESTLTALAEELREHRIDCLQVRRDANAAQLATNAALLSINKDIADFKALPMKAVRWIGLTILGAMLSIGVQNFYLHEQTDTKAQIAAQQATATAATQGVVIDKLTKLQAATGAEK